MTEELINYIKENLARGVSQDQIHQTLLNTGWQQADINAAFSQLGIPQSPLPPVSNITQSTQSPPTKPKEPKSFLNPKIIIAVVAIIILLTAGIGSHFLFSKEGLVTSENEQTKTSGSQNQSISGEDQISIPQAGQTQESSREVPRTWTECKVFPNESDYVPERIFMPEKIGEDFVADSRGDYQPQGFLGEYVRIATQESLKVLKPEDFGPQFSIVVKKRSSGENGDIDKIWKTYNESYSPLGPKLVRKTFFGHAASIVSGDSGEGLQTIIYSLISAHDIFIEINAKGDGTKAETYYKEWLSTICQKS